LRACKDLYPAIQTPQALCDKADAIRKFASQFQIAATNTVGGLKYHDGDNGLTAPRAVILLAALKGKIKGQFGYKEQAIEEDQTKQFPQHIIIIKEESAPRQGVRPNDMTQYI
jgi:hypothetical protein